MNINDLVDHYKSVRNYSLKLTKPLSSEDHNLQPETFVSPAKWHLAHTTWFFEEMLLKPGLKGYKEFNSLFVKLFNSYYQTVGKPFNRAQRGNISRPSLEEVLQYRTFVDEHMLKLFNSSPTNEQKELAELGLNHEQQHQELLLTDIKFAFSINPLNPIYSINGIGINVIQPSTSNEWIDIEEGMHTIGHSGNGFCFDNELGQHQVFLPSFKISKQLVANEEYLAFIEDGGYKDFKFWLDDGWTWINENSIEWPLYWEKIDGNWHSYTLAGMKPIEPKAILTHISYYEANAFAAWKGCRLPTEFEWEAAASKINWGKRWEWTNSAYLPYPGFEISPNAVGEYNGKFMSNQMVLRGSSIATPNGHSRKTYRNFFQPTLRWQFNGIRLAK
ncbi:MAG: ergothioneine biosynthesis protein EgtB [Bacteroidetes bacterium]|nr:ergothioneine biosynthesis protein EgtB [Bacteroidota bacterium]